MVQRLTEEIRLLNRGFIAVFILLGVICLWSITQQPAMPLVVLLLVIICIPLLFGKMVISVSDDELVVAFGYARIIKRRIALSDIKSAEVVTYRPIREFGGWGIRCGIFRGEATSCLSLKGNKGVLFSVAKEIRVCLIKTNKLIVGSQDSERLLKAIRGTS